MAGVQRVVVIGAGIVGAAAAARLAAAGARVTVVDNGAVGGATAAGAGIIATISSTVTDDETAAFRFAAARHYRHLLQRCADAGIEGGSYRSAGQLTVALRSAECEELQADFDRTRDLVARHGPDSVGQPELLTAGDIAARFPLVGPTFGGRWPRTWRWWTGARCATACCGSPSPRVLRWLTAPRNSKSTGASMGPPVSMRPAVG